MSSSPPPPIPPHPTAPSNALDALAAPDEPAPPANVDPSAPLQLIAPLPAPLPARGRAAAVALKAALADAALPMIADTAPYDAPPPIDVSDLEKLGISVELSTDASPLPVRLVPARRNGAITDGAVELSFKDAAVLRRLVEAFPGARVVSLKAPAGEVSGAGLSAVSSETSAAVESGRGGTADKHHLPSAADPFEEP